MSFLPTVLLFGKWKDNKGKIMRPDGKALTFDKRNGVATGNESVGQNME